jgi:2-dehydro-3-deoxy-D-arabinonate dehydratase
MLLTKLSKKDDSFWAINGSLLPSNLDLSKLLEMSSTAMFQLLNELSGGESAVGELAAPIDPYHEVWAAGVTYLRSRDARKDESTVADMYERVYEAARPELFFKSLGWRVAGTGGSIRIRSDSKWNVPEPELVLVINKHGEIVGYCAGNDVSSRDIEGENPLYLPQAKNYNGACALGHGIWLCPADEIREIPIRLAIRRAGENIFEAETTTATMKRTLPELVQYLTVELDFPQGVLLMTGTCLVPGSDFTLQPGDLVVIQVGRLMIENSVSA